MHTAVHHSALRTLHSTIVLWLALLLVCICPAPGLAGGGFVISGYPSLSAEAPGNLANRDGASIDLGTGAFIPSTTDLVVPDVIPLVLTRTYRTNDAFARPFGVGSSHPYEVFLIGDENNCTYAQLILPDGARIHYERTSGSGCPGSTVMTHTATPTPFYKSTLSWNSTRPGWNLTLTEGTVYQFTVKTVAPSFVPTNVLDAIQDRNGNRVTLTRDPVANQRITRVTSPNGRYIDFTYSVPPPGTILTYGFQHQIIQARDHSGRTVTYTYDTSNRLIRLTNPAGGVSESTYDSAHRLLTVTDARGVLVLTNGYYSDGRMYYQIQADGTAFYFSYLINSDNKVTTAYVYHPNGALRKVDFNTGGYNGSGYTTSDTQALNQPGQQTVTIERQSGTNFVSAVVDPLNRRTTYAYNSKGRVTAITRMAGTAQAVTSSFTYEPTFNQVQTATDPLGHTSSFTYDSVGNLVALSGSNQQYTTLAYNSDGQPTAIADWVDIPTNNYLLTQFGYNTLGDLTLLVDGLGNVTTREFDSAGRLTKLMAPLKQKTTYQYDALSRLTKMTDPLTGQTQFTYDANSNLLSVKDAKDHTTAYTYDLMNRPVTRTDPVGRSESYQYDANSNLTRVTDRKTQATTFVYDLLNRRTQTTSADSATTYTYDQGNRVTQANDSLAGATLWAYDNLNRVTAEGTNREIIGYNYDAAGRRTNAVTTVGNKTLTYTYDNSNRVQQITEGTSSVGFLYDKANRRTKLTLPNGVTVDTVYDQASRITGLTYKQGSTVLGNLTYGYDANGRRTNVGGSMARTNLPAPFTSATYDNANRQMTMGTRGMAYDNNGNLTSLTEATGLSTFTWNARNQLAGMTGPGLSASFLYDPLGRRIKRTLNSAITQFAHDGINVVEELSASGSVTATLLTGLGIDEVFRRTDASGGSQHFLRDVLGSTVALLDSLGLIQTEYTSTPFGETTATGMPSANAFQFTGRENDGTGLAYHRARYYHPVLQRFISEDPLGFGGGDVNLYGYTGNDPINLTDPTGQDPFMFFARPSPFFRGPGSFPQGPRYLAPRPGQLTPLKGAAPRPELRYVPGRPPGSPDISLETSKPAPFGAYTRFVGEGADALGVPSYGATFGSGLSPLPPQSIPTPVNSVPTAPQNVPIPQSVPTPQPVPISPMSLSEGFPGMI